MANLSDEQRRAVVEFLLKASFDGALQHGDVSSAAAHFHCSRWSIARTWRRYNESLSAGNISGRVESKKKGRAGRKGYDKAALLASIQTLSHSKRTKIRTLAAAVRVSVGVVQRLLKTNAIVRRTNTIMPSLTDANKIDRVRFAVSHVNAETLVFDSMHDVVHIDEKWFNEDVDKRVYYLLPGEQPPQRRRQSKRFSGKTMFLAAVARPRKCMFDGKIGLWPFVEEYVAKRNSKNRPKGTMLTVDMEVVNRDVYRQFLIDCVIPAIKMKWPARDRHKTIYIQQDNAKPHVFPDDEAIVAAGQSDGWDIRLRCQPPNSPDCNVLDLGYFRAIQSLQYEQEIYETDDLIAVVTAAFATMSAKKLNHVFLSLQSVLECIMGEFGDNGYKLPHTAKVKLERQGKLPLSITCDSTVYHSAVAFLALSTST